MRRWRLAAGGSVAAALLTALGGCPTFGVAGSGSGAGGLGPGGATSSASHSDGTGAMSNGGGGSTPSSGGAGSTAASCGTGGAGGSGTGGQMCPGTCATPTLDDAVVLADKDSNATIAVLGIAYDDAGAVYVAGSYSGLPGLACGSGSIPTGTDGLFVAQFGANHKCKWVQAAPAASLDPGKPVVLRVQGSKILVAGTFKGTISYPSTMGDDFHLHHTGSDLFVLGLTTGNGKASWANGYSGVQVSATGADILGNAAHVVGTFTGALTFSDAFSFAAQFPKVYGFDAELHLDSGELQTAQEFVSTSEFKLAGVVLDPDGSTFTGSFKGMANFAGDNESANGMSEAFVARYPTTGPVKLVKFGAGDSDSTQTATGLARLPDQGVVATGTFDQSLKLPGGATYDPTGAVTSYVIALQSNGTLAWAYRIETDTAAANQVNAVATTSRGRVAVAGIYGPAALQAPACSLAGPTMSQKSAFALAFDRSGCPIAALGGLSSVDADGEEAVGNAIAWSEGCGAPSLAFAGTFTNGLTLSSAPPKSLMGTANDSFVAFMHSP